MDNRIRTFTGIHNFRDYGGYAVPGGKLKQGLLWRSAQHKDATAADLEQIATINLQAVYDLRGITERQEAPCPRPAGFSAQVFAADGETAGSRIAPHLQAARLTNTPEGAHHFMVMLNEDMPFRDHLVTMLRAYLADLATRDGASLVHCVAGKDRTGLAVAVFHSLMGVSDEDVMADYLLTNTAGNIEARIASLRAQVSAQFAAQRDDATSRALLSVHPDYLATALRMINERHGSVRAYAAEVLGVDDAMLAAMQTRWIV